MFKLYAILIVVGLLGGAVYGAKYYYDTTQNTIASLRENNAKLEVANETNQATIKKMGQDTARLNDLTNQLAQDLQTSERYVFHTSTQIFQKTLIAYRPPVE